MSILASRKVARLPEKNVASETGLIKPRLANAQESPTVKPAESRDKSKPEIKHAGNVPDRSNDKPPASSKTVAAAAALEPRDVDKAPQLGEKTDASVRTSKQEPGDALPAKRESVRLEANPKPNDGRQADALSEDKTKKGEEPVVKKHDHAKYVVTIRNKAIDQINKEKDVVLARVCRNATTEEWTLTLYRKKQKTYSFVDYAWDEIDGKWEQAFVSNQRPLSGFRQHLEFSSSDKECAVLKGRFP